MDRDRLPHLIMKYQPCGKQSQGQSPKDFLTVMGPEQVKRPKTLQAICC
jgi:hypothetical protein